jgi:hypothetical protein
VPVNAVETVVNDSQPPVGATTTDPSNVPDCEPDRTSIVPPAPADDTRAVNDLAPTVDTDEYPTQSPWSM